MATTTSNLGLTKPSYSDTADIAVVNGNMDILDTAVNAVENGIAIIANGNSHAAITSGQFVYVRGHGTLSEGMYKATSNIATNATLSNSNLSAVSGGLGAEVATLSEQIGNLRLISKPLAGNSSITYEFSHNARFIITVVGYSFVFVVGRSTSDGLDFANYNSANTDITVTKSGRVLTITNNVSSSKNTDLLLFYGSVT